MFKIAAYHFLLILCCSRISAQSLKIDITIADTLLFPESEVLIGTIDDFEIDNNGNIFLVDRLAQEVYYLSKRGKLIRSVSPVLCSPGFTLSPWSIALNSEYLFLNNDGPWGYLFNSDGTCLSEVDDRYVTLLYFGFKSDNTLYGILRGFNDIPYKLVLASKQGVTSRQFELPNGKFTNADRFIEGGGLAYIDNNYYFAPSVSPALFRVNNKTGKLSQIEITKMIDLDTPDVDLKNGEKNAAFIKESSKIVLSNNINRGVYILNDKYMFLQYSKASSSGGEWKWLIFDLNDKSIRTKSDSDFGFFRVYDNYGYRLVQPRMNDNNEIPNPFLVKYKIIITVTN